ncbi:MAG: zinc-binding dehydrogenase [Armatimonadetes bacterium]|nr:zinc-binding dehydrogenase [Armatimonadota bacterium]MDE2205388.1 zinc-binding dehydrogenase [Armatimonadota bacterium]
MRAVTNLENKPHSVELQDRPLPQAGPNEVLLRVKCVGVCGSDLHQWHASQSWPVNYPVTLGHEFCGEVAECGSGVSQFRPGDRVVSETAAVICGECAYCRTGAYNLCPKRLGFGYGIDGAMADYVRVPARCLHRIPTGVSFEDAAMTEPASVGANAVLELSRIEPGDTVIVMGPGTIGLMALQMCRLQSPGTLILSGLSRDARRLELGKALGADMSIAGDTVDLAALVAGVGDGLGAHLIVDCTGVSSVLSQCLALARPGGQITKVGWGREPFNASLDPLVQKALRLQGSFSHTWATWERVLGLMQRGALNLAPMRRVFPLAEWQAAFEAMDSLEVAKSLLTP